MKINPLRRQIAQMKIPVKHFIRFGVFALMIAAITQLSACGFHLRGTQKVPAIFQDLYIQTDQPNSYFIKQLKYQLTRNQVSLANHTQNSSAVIDVSPVETSTSLVALTGNAEAGQYLIKSSVKIWVFDKRGKTIIAKTTLTKTSYASSNATQKLGANIQTAAIAQKLKDALAQQVITLMVNYNEQTP